MVNQRNNARVRNWQVVKPLLIFAVGAIIGKVTPPHSLLDSNIKKITLRMTSSEVRALIGEPLSTRYYFYPMPPEEWPSEARAAVLDGTAAQALVYRQFAILLNPDGKVISIAGR